MAYYYDTGERIIIGDVVRYGGEEGRIVFLIDEGAYAPGYPKHNWEFLRKGIGIAVTKMNAPFHLEDSDEDLDLVARDGEPAIVRSADFWPPLLMGCRSGTSPMFSSEADKFFAPPSVSFPLPDYLGTLFLLRKDIISSLGRNPGTSNPTGCFAPLAGAMAILAGVDLLAKFASGEDAPQEVAARFRNFLHKYFQLGSTDNEETICRLRDALIGSFGLRSQDDAGREYRFDLTYRNGPLITAFDVTGQVEVRVIALQRQFEGAVESFRKDTNDSAVLQRNFNRMFPKYGSVFVK
jgi:hypothetical protein